MKLQIPQNLSYTATSRRNLGKKSILMRLFNKYYNYRSAITKFRISAHTFPVESGKWDKTPREERMCPLCFSNDIDDEKHYIFHCTNPKLVEIRKTFTPEIHETLTPYPDVNSSMIYSILF